MPLEKNRTEARQGVTHQGGRYVLGISFALAAIVLILAYFFVF